MTLFQSRAHTVAVVSLIAWLLLNAAWELYLAPLRPNGTWLVLKIVPLLFCLRGVLKANLYTLQIAAMLVLLFMAESLVRAMGAGNAALAACAWVSFVLSWLFFFGCILHVRPYKTAFKQAQKANKA